ncbi:membrane fusion protein, multidrug efflux system [Solimonas aquatica]|uniref:Membrane fusion protein, multidrug efflux system n=1 Tax=Solimonas aquatica TaxID=489703 RepID=A0A1H8ZU50_9GAMM|nr:efflux RND transporter periplasmic adaptor subunit [Solimonas aquatica]SEP67904.1 membrane fusion protein, multidrug efflux system [Solimonas aquatica]
MRKISWITAFVLLLALLAVPKLLPLLHAQGKGGESNAASAGQDGGGKSREGKSGKGEGRPLKVSTLKLQPTRFTETLSSTGTLIAEEAVELQAETSGKVVRINFAEGTPVRKGALLLKLNDAELQATRERARQRLVLAQSREQRVAPLVDRGLVSPEEYDNVRAEVAVQKAEIDLAEAQIARTEIRAPFDGVVGLRYVSEGSYVNAATRVATLQRLDKLKIDFSVPEQYASRIRSGAAVQFSVAGTPGRHQGRIYAVDPRIDAATRTVLIRAVCANPKGQLLPGAFASVELVLDEIGDALLVPAAAVIPGLEKKNVYVLGHQGKAERRAVDTGTRTATQVLILSGLNAGDTVITSGLQQLKDGQAVSTDEGGGKRARHAAGATAPTPSAP